MTSIKITSLKPPLKLGWDLLRKEEIIKLFLQKKNAQQVYREEIQEAKEQYEKQLKNAKEQYQVRLREAKRILKENLASERSGKHERYSTTKEYYKIISNRPEIPIGIKRKRK